MKYQDMLTEMTRSLEFTQGEVVDLQHQVKELQKEKKNNEATIMKMNEELLTSEEQIKNLEDRCNYQEDYSRRNNLQITGLPENQSETWEHSATVVSKLLEEKLQLPNIELERVHRVGQPRDHHHRPIIARFNRFCGREAVLRGNASQASRHECIY